HQQGEWVEMLEFGLRLRIGGAEAAERLGDLGGCPLREVAVRGLCVGSRPARWCFQPCGFALACLYQGTAHGLVTRRLAFADRLLRHALGIISTMTADNDDTL